MTDRELIEAAAKAGGVVGEWDIGCPGFVTDFNEATGRFVIFDPLTDDGDALRLAVKLRIEHTFSSQATWVQTEPVPLHVEMLHEPYGADPYAATRRAIVRAAAAMAA